MLDPYAELTPEEEAAITQAQAHVTRASLRKAAERDAAWAKERAQIERTQRIPPPRPPRKPKRPRDAQSPT